MSNVALNDTDALCTAAQLAKVLGVSTRSIDMLALEGVFKAVRSSKLRARHYRLRDSVQRFVAYQKQSVRAQFASNNGAYNDARTRRMNAIAIVEEARAKQISGEYVRRDHVVFVMTRSITQAKNHLLGLPARLARQLIAQKDPHKVREILDTNIRNCLTEVSKIGAHSFDEKRTNGERESDDD